MWTQEELDELAAMDDYNGENIVWDDGEFDESCHDEYSQDDDDAFVLASANWGTDEDYGCYGYDEY